MHKCTKLCLEKYLLKCLNEKCRVHVFFVCEFFFGILGGSLVQNEKKKHLVTSAKLMVILFIL